MKSLLLSLLIIAPIVGSCNKTQPVVETKNTPSKPEFKAYQILAHNPTNVNFSPITLQQLATLLKLDQISGSLTEKQESKNFSTANSVWTKSKKHPLKPKEINDWIVKNSCGNFTEFYEKMEPKTNTIMLSSLCFHGKFLHSFDSKNTIPAHFQSSPYGSSGIKLMRKTGDFRYFEDESAQWLELPLQNSSIVMWLALPRKKFELNKIEGKISTEYLSTVEKGLKDHQVEVSIPKFQLNQKLSIKDLLMQLGAEFDSRSGRSNFTEIAQIASFNMNELGINAEEENGTKSEKESSGFSLRSNKFEAVQPFLVVIKNINPDEIILLGRVYKP